MKNTKSQLQTFLTFVTFSLFLVLVNVQSAVAAPNGPNILFFLVDDMGTQDLSEPFAYDDDGHPIKTKTNKLYRTPNVERLARNGVKFTNAYAYTICSPTRVSLMTGLAAPRHHVTQWTYPDTSKKGPMPVRSKTLREPDWRTRGIPSDATLLTNLLKENGYTNLFAGKAHFGPNDTPNGDPLNLGFDVNIAGHGAGGPGSYYGKHNYSAAHRGGARKWDVPGLEKYHGTDVFLTEALTREMKKAITATVEKNKPFFAYMSHYAVHAPFRYPDKRFTKNYPQLKGSKLAFATLVEGVDKSLGDLIRHLEELGVASDTLIVFLSDNGSASPLGTPGLRGKKGTRFEGGTRVPLIVSWANVDPDHPLQQKFPIDSGSRNDSLVTCLDMMPTLLELTGTEIPDQLKLDGRSIVDLIRDRQSSHENNEFLVHFPHRHRNALFSTFVRDNWKIIYKYDSKNWALYNLEDDPQESRNLVNKRPEKAHNMAEAMIRQLDANNAQYPIKRSDGSPAKPKPPSGTN